MKTLTGTVPRARWRLLLRWKSRPMLWWQDLSTHHLQAHTKRLYPAKQHHEAHAHTLFFCMMVRGAANGFIFSSNGYYFHTQLCWSSFASGPNPSSSHPAPNSNPQPPALRFAKLPQDAAELWGCGIEPHIGAVGQCSDGCVLGPQLLQESTSSFEVCAESMLNIIPHLAECYSPSSSSHHPIAMVF